MYYTNEGVGSTAIQVRFYRNAECVSLLRGICGLAALAKVVQKKTNMDDLVRSVAKGEQFIHFFGIHHPQIQDS